MNRGDRHVVIAGGGITGLAAAFYIHTFSKERGIPVRLTLVEQSERMGGRISTLRWNGHKIEQGPDSFLARKHHILDLTRELGLTDELVPTNPQAKKTYILHNRKLHPMPPGLVLGVPTKWAPFIRTGLLSPAGKLRAAMDLILPRGQQEGDESLGHFFQRRLGPQVLTRIAEPILAGIYSGDIHELSLLATFPQFRQMEKKHRSLMLGMMNSQKQNQQRSASKTLSSDQLPESIRHSVFLSYRNGLSTLVEKLQSELEPHVEWRLGERLQSISYPNGEEGGSIKLHTSKGHDQLALDADAVILALPASAYHTLFPDSSEAQQFAEMRYVSVANVVFAYDAAKVNHPLNGSGFVISRAEQRFITACTWTSSKWGHTAPKGRVLIRCYVGRAGEEAWMNLDEESIIRGVKRELRELLGITEDPEYVNINRHVQAMPQYGVGHLDRVKALREMLAHKAPGVYATGSAFEGIGIPDCIRQGKEAAEQALGRFL